MTRLFVALRPPPDMRERLRATMHSLPGARWQTEEQLHLTLRFIGDVDRHRCDDIVAALGRVRGHKLSLGVDGVGAFTSKGRLNSIWAAVPLTAELARIAKSVDRALVGVGLASEARAFHPHITLARLGRSALRADRWIETNAALHVDAAPFEHSLLYESVLGTDGSTYIVVERYPLY